MPTDMYRLCLAEAARHHVDAKTYSGSLVRVHARWIRDLIRETGARTLLDYGCGKGEQYGWVVPETGQPLAEYWGVAVTKYDPAVRDYAAEPKEQHDIVICTHVLGSIPVADLPWVVDRLYSLARKGLYIAEKLGPVKKAVFSRPDCLPRDWSAEQWHATLRRPHRIRAIAAFRHRDPPTIRHMDL